MSKIFISLLLVSLSTLVQAETIAYISGATVEVPPLKAGTTVDQNMVTVAVAKVDLNNKPAYLIAEAYVEFRDNKAAELVCSLNPVGETTGGASGNLKVVDFVLRSARNQGTNPQEINVTTNAFRATSAKVEGYNKLGWALKCRHTESSGHTYNVYGTIKVTAQF